MPSDGKVQFVNGRYYVHFISRCEGRNLPCVIHFPSDHRMRAWPMILRETALVERVCDHDIGHPDPDSVMWFDSIGIRGYGIHGCDGCCQEPRIVEPEPVNSVGQTLSVVWIDSGLQFPQEWMKETNIISKSKAWRGVVRTAGTVIYEDESVIVLGLTHDAENDMWFGAQLIYKQCIEERTNLD